MPGGDSSQNVRREIKQTQTIHSSNFIIKESRKMVVWLEWEEGSREGFFLNMGKVTAKIFYTDGNDPVDRQKPIKQERAKRQQQKQ